MSGPPDLAAEARKWVEVAEHDLRDAEHVLTLQEDCPTDTVCFHSRQCAEKYLKALLVLRGTAFPRTHDLVLLFNLAASAATWSLRVEQLQPLNRYSVEAPIRGLGSH